jgi:hypothetical protein
LFFLFSVLLVSLPYGRAIGRDDAKKGGIGEKEAGE